MDYARMGFEFLWVSQRTSIRPETKTQHSSGVPQITANRIQATFGLYDMSIHNTCGYYCVQVDIGVDIFFGYHIQFMDGCQFSSLWISGDTIFLRKITVYI